MGSTRLPGKVLKEIIPGESVLSLLIKRIKPARLVDKIIVATTNKREDDIIEQVCFRLEIQVFRGSDWDVLDRFYQTAIIARRQDQRINTIVRLTADSPLNSHKMVDSVISGFKKAGKDYFANANQEPDYLEDGFGVEVFTFSALEIAWQNATLPYDREHVCPYIKKHFNCEWMKTNANYTFKLSVDTQEDFEVVQKVFEELACTIDFSIDEVVDLLIRKPEILKINQKKTD